MDNQQIKNILNKIPLEWLAWINRKLFLFENFYIKNIYQVVYSVYIKRIVVKQRSNNKC